MGLLDRFKKTEIIEREVPVLADYDTQLEHQRLLNMATTYVKTKTDIIKKHSSYQKKLSEQADWVTKKTIMDWRLSLQSARDISRPNRYWLLDLYAEMKLDPFLDAVSRYQADKLTHITRHVEDENGNIDEKATKLFNSPWFDQLIRGFTQAEQEGFVLFEINEIVKYKGDFTIDRLNEVPSKHVIPERGEIKTDAYTDTAGVISYLNDDFVIEIINKDRRNLGSLSKLAPYLIWKKLAMNSWSNFIEDFGSPSMIIKSPIKNTDKETELLNSLQNIGSSLRMVLDSNDEFELVQPNSNDVYMSFQEMIKGVDDVISNEVVGGTLLFRNGDSGSYNLGSVQQGVSELKTNADLKTIQKYVNHFLIPKLKRIGLLEDKELYLNFNPEEYLTTPSKSEIIRGLAPFMKFNKEWLEDYLKIKIDDMDNGNPNGIDPISE